MLLTFKEAFFWTRLCNAANVHLHTHTPQSTAIIYIATSAQTAPNMTFNILRETCNITHLVCKIALDLLPFRTSQLFFVTGCWAAICGPTWALVKIHAVITRRVWLEEHFINTSINKTKASNTLIKQSFFNKLFLSNTWFFVIDLLWQSNVIMLFNFIKYKRNRKTFIWKKNQVKSDMNFYFQFKTLWKRKVILLPFTKGELSSPAYNNNSLPNNNYKVIFGDFGKELKEGKQLHSNIP